MGAVGGSMPEPAGGERRHVPLYGRLVAEEQLAAMAAPSDIQVSAVARNPRAFCCYRTPVQVNDARGSLWNGINQVQEKDPLLTHPSLADRDGSNRNLEQVDYTFIESKVKQS